MVFRVFLLNTFWDWPECTVQDSCSEPKQLMQNVGAKPAAKNGSNGELGKHNANHLKVADI